MSANGGTYTVEYNGLVGQVKAYNQLSAEAEIKWVDQNMKCFCEDCRAWLAKQHLVTLTGTPLPGLNCLRYQHN
jgi:hypothetical protein